MTAQTMQQVAAHHFGIAWDELSPFEQAHWEAAYRAGRAGVAAENDRLKEHIVAMQADPGSWQSGYTRGRTIGTKLALSERDQLKADNESLQRQCQRQWALITTLEVDAERYRWLRDFHIGDDPESINLDSAPRQKGLDAAIDRALAKEPSHD